MARVDVTITQIPAFLAGANLTATVGSAQLAVDVESYTRPVMLVASNSNASTVSFNILGASGSGTFNAAVTKTQTVPAIAGSVEGKRGVVLDAKYIAQSDGKIHIDSSDPNIGDVSFYAFTWAPTRA